MADKKPYEIARETLKALTARKLVPSPENYQAIYHEISGLPRLVPFPSEQLHALAHALPAQNPGQRKQRGLLEYAIEQRNWNAVQSALVAYTGFSMAAANNAAAEAGPGRAVVVPGTSIALPLTPEFLEQVARLIENALPALGSDDSRFSEQARQLVQYLRQPGLDLQALKIMLGNFTHRLSFAAEDQAEIRKILLRLLHLIIENIGQLSIDDQWLKGQIDALLGASTPPLTLRRLDDVERRLKDVIFKQSEAKARSVDMQDQMKRLLATFVERLSMMSESSGVYQDKIEQCARLIEQAHSLEDIGPVLQDAIAATRNMADESVSVRDELRQMREKTEAAEAEISKLHLELDRVSAQARHDPLTGVLNRKGLDEAIEREIAIVRRKGTMLSLSLLDIDNFKAINDNLGHDTGDAALQHLALVARESMRPQDTLARFGGEEFIILMPDTAMEAGIEAMTRLQRELTKRFFLKDNEKVLITFSAGVTAVAADEPGIDAIRRADGAMYLAKRAGKNRVLGA